MTIGRLDLSALSFLVVDDGRFMRLIIKQILRGLGATNYKEAEDGQDALGVLSAYSADIIILDLMMEPMNGVEFIRNFRASKGATNPKAPVIVLTAYSNGPAIENARDAGATEFILTDRNQVFGAPCTQNARGCGRFRTSCRTLWPENLVSLALSKLQFTR